MAMNVIKIKKENLSTTNNGVFQGWGTSLCWWANRVGYSPVLTQKCAELFYGNSGLNMNIMRYNIGGGDDPTHKHIKRTDSMIPGWLIKKPDDSLAYDYAADVNQLNVLKACYNACLDNTAYVEVFSNSPPYFMTISGCSSGGENPNKNNLRDDCFEAFAKYLANVTEYINNTLGIKVSSISPMNEPNTDFWKYMSPKQEGCHFDCGATQNRIIIETAAAVKDKDLFDVEIIGSDETSTDKAILAYNNYTDEVKKTIDRISTHTYGTKRISTLGKLMKAEKRNLWMSETDWGETAGKNAEEMGAGLWLANKIIYDINNLSPSAWVLWQTIDYHKSRNGYMGNIDSGIPDTKKGYWGIAFADHDTQEIILTKKYYTFAQFTKFINPGDTIIHCGKKSLGAINDKRNEIKIVLVNDTSRASAKTIDVSDFVSSGKYRYYRTSGNMADGENLKGSEIFIFNNGTVKINIPQNSITTLIIN